LKALSLPHCRNIITPILKRVILKLNKDIFLCHCPERILPGDLFKEIINNDRIIVGLDDRACQMAADIYTSFV